MLLSRLRFLSGPLATSHFFLGSFAATIAWLAARGWMILAVIPLIALWGIAAPAMQSLMSRHVDPSSQGKLQGAINSLRAITGMIGPVLFTQIFTLAIAPRFGFYLPGAPYLLAALLLFSSLLLAAYVTRSKESIQGAAEPASSLDPSE